MDLSTESIIPVVESQWSEQSPSLSPDNTKIAFISNRTGIAEIWLLNLENLDFQQITGGIADYFDSRFDSRYSNLQWINNNQLLITIFKDRKSIAVYISVD